MENSEYIKAAISVPLEGITFKENKYSLVVYAPNYSSHSAFLDDAFAVARGLNIKYRSSGHNFGETYTVTFYKKK